MRIKGSEKLEEDSKNGMRNSKRKQNEGTRKRSKILSQPSSENEEN